MLQVLNVAVGVTFVFLLFSLIVSALNEVWLSYLDKRAEFLKEGLSELFGDVSDTAAPISTDQFLRHGLITCLSRGQLEKTGTRGVPSYVPGKSFVLAVLSLLDQRSGTITALDQQIASLPESKLKESLAALYNDAGGDLLLFKANLENWFNQTMDRVGGWYKRYSQMWLLWLGLSIAVVCNVDAIRIVSALATDPKLRQEVTEQAVEHVRAAKAAETADPTTAPQPTASPAPTSALGAVGAAARTGLVDVQKSLADLGATGVPVGWTASATAHLFPHDANELQILGRWLAAIAGWLVTALAASLGAPFWFDLLNRFVDLRGVGRAPEEKDPTAPKKKPLGVESYLKPAEASDS